jgi:hypothetical protein
VEGTAFRVCVRTYVVPGDSDLIITVPSTPTAATCWAIVIPPCGLDFSFDLFHSRTEKLVLPHSLKSVLMRLKAKRLEPWRF